MLLIRKNASSYPSSFSNKRKRLQISLSLLLLIFLSQSAVQAQSISVTGVSVTPVCAGSTATITFTAVNGTGGPSKYDGNTIYNIYLSDSSGTTWSQPAISSFSTTGVTYNTSNGGSTSGIQKTVTIPANAIYGTTYKIAIGSTSPNFNSKVGASSDFTIFSNPTITGTTTASRNGPGALSLGATASAGSINWYADLTGGSSLITGTSYTTPSIATTTTYYVDATVNGCTSSPRTAVSATINSPLNVTPSTLDFGYIANGGTSSSRSYILSGQYLSGFPANITVTAPTNFQVSLSAGSGFSSSVVVPYSTSNLADTTIYVLFKPTANGIAYSGAITNSGGGGAANVTVNGTSKVPCLSSGNTTYQTGITSVIFNTINNPTAKPSGYSNYTSQITNVKTGSSYDLTVNINTDGNFTVFANAWIDWNQDGDFGDANETVDLGSAVSTSNGATSLSPKNIIIPCGAAIGNTRMRVSAKYNGYPTSCEAGFDGEVEDYTLNIIQVAPTTTAAVICVGSTASLSASGAVSGDRYRWYNASSGGTLLKTSTDNSDNTYTTQVLGETTYYWVSILTTGGCESARIKATVTVNPLPSAVGTITGTATVCQGQSSVAYSVPAIANANSYTWTYSGTGATITGTTNNVTITFASNATAGNLTVRGANSCGNGTVSANYAVVINSVPTITGTTPGSRIGIGTVILGATASAGTINWYVAAIGGASLGTGTSFTTPSISTTTTYYVDATGNVCTSSPRTAVTAIVSCAAGSDNIDYERIIQLQLGTINNPSTIITGGYSDFSSISTNVDIGNSYPVTVTNGYLDVSSQVGVWVDWNQNGVFTDSGEFFSTTRVDDKFSSTIIPPMGAKIGSSRMRVRIMYTGTLDPCGNTNYGEVEDYTLNVSPVITGTTPGSRCGTGTVVLGAMATAGSTINWYSAATAGLLLGTGTSFTTASISSTGSYWVDATSNGFTTGSRTAVIATVDLCINKWKGTISTAWNIPGNWTQNIVPAVDTSIVFDDSPVNHCFMDQDRSVTDITNSQSTYGLVLNGNKLTLKGSLFFTGGATIDASIMNSTIQFSGSTVQTINAGVFKNDAVYNLNINNSNNVQLSGNLRLLNNLTSTTGLLDAFTNSPVITYAGSTLQTIGSNQFQGGQVYNLTVDNSLGVNLNTNFTVTNTLLINANKIFSVLPLYQLTALGTITNNSTSAGFVLMSNATGTASLLHNSNNVAARVQRYITGAKEDWHFLSSPVFNQSINGSWLPSGTYGNGTGFDLYVWNEPTFCWIYKSNITSVVNWNTVHPLPSFVAGRGYLYSVQALNPTKEFAGNLNNGLVIFPISISATTDASLINLKGFNLVGNPYPSSIDWSASTGWTRSNLADSAGGKDMWIWNPAVNNYGVYNSATLIGTNAITRYIAPMQGYFVKAVSSGSLELNNSTRVHTGAGNWFKNKNEKSGLIRIKVLSEANKNADEALIQFGYTENRPGAAKLFSHILTAPSLYMETVEDSYSVRYFTNTIDNKAIPVSFKPGIDGYFSLIFEFDSKEFETVLLEDRLLKTLITLESTRVYKFNASKNDDANRFVVHFNELDAKNINKLPAIVYSKGSQLIVDLSVVNVDTEVICFDVLGKLLLRADLEGQKVHKLAINSATQMLLIHLKNENGEVKTKVLFNPLK